MYMRLLGARLVEIESEGGSWSRLKQLVLPGGVRRIGDKSFAEYLKVYFGKEQ